MSHIKITGSVVVSIDAQDLDKIVIDDSALSESNRTNETNSEHVKDDFPVQNEYYENCSITIPLTPVKKQSRVCECACECWKREDYQSLAPRKAGYKENTESINGFSVVMACRHFASCRLNGTTCVLD